MPHNYFASQARADRLIRKFGRRVTLNAGATITEAFGVEVEFTPQERRTLVNPVSRLFLLTPVGLGVVPDQHKHILVTYRVPATDPATMEERLKIDAPPGRFAPGGIVIYWEL